MRDITNSLEEISVKLGRLMEVVDILDFLMEEEANKLNGGRTCPDDTKERICSLTDMIKAAIHQRDEETQQVVDLCMALERGGAIA